jgi:hypothetical protein
MNFNFGKRPWNFSDAFCCVLKCWKLQGVKNFCNF